jgi:hypothetical protein
MKGIILLCWVLTLLGRCQAFQASTTTIIRFPMRQQSVRQVMMMRMSDDNDDDDDNDNDNLSSEDSSPDVLTSSLTRILSPKIDDRGLPLSDAFAAQIIGPSLQVFWLVSVSAPRPSWLNVAAALFDDRFRGALLAPTLIHGAALSCCWLLGALVARAFEEDAIDPTVSGYSTVLWRIFQAGCFASGCLVFSTQLDLLLEFGRYVQPGESPAIDTRLLSAWTEVLNDIFFEILAIVPLRLYLAYSIARDKQ